MLTREEMRELLAKVAEERGWPSTARNLREDNIFCGNVEIGNVYEAMRRVYSLTHKFDWEPLAKALFQIEHDPSIPDQAWFDFQGKAQRIIAALNSPAT